MEGLLTERTLFESIVAEETTVDDHRMMTLSLALDESKVIALLEIKGLLEMAKKVSIAKVKSEDNHSFTAELSHTEYQEVLKEGLELPIEVVQQRLNTYLSQRISQSFLETLSKELYGGIDTFNKVSRLFMSYEGAEVEFLTEEIVKIIIEVEGIEELKELARQGHQGHRPDLGRGIGDTTFERIKRLFYVALTLQQLSK